MERRGPGDGSPNPTARGRAGVIKPTIRLQNLRRRIYIKAKAEHGWKRWSRAWLYRVLGLYGDYAIRYHHGPKARPAGTVS